MSRLGEELAKIAEGFDGTSTGTSDVGLEVKRIVKALDPDASTDGGVLENVIKIRELVEDGKGGGGSLNLVKYTIVVDNQTGSDIDFSSFYFTGVLNENGEPYSHEVDDPFNPGSTTIDYTCPLTADGAEFYLPASLDPSYSKFYIRFDASGNYSYELSSEDYSLFLLEGGVFVEANAAEDTVVTLTISGGIS